MRAVARVHVLRAVVGDRLETEIRGAGPVEDRADARRRDVGVRARRGAGAKTGVGDCDRLRRAVEAAGIGERAAQDLRRRQTRCA